MLEFEKKRMLSKNAMQYLERCNFGEKEKTVLVNHYYDTSDFSLNRSGITCRIREKKGQYTATIKAHRLCGSDCSTEHSRALQNGKDDCIFRNMGLIYQGALKTRRTVLQPEIGIKIMLDRNKYLGTVDYELEIEYAPEKELLAAAVLAEIETVLREKGLSGDTQLYSREQNGAKSKSERFFARKKTLFGKEK